MIICDIRRFSRHLPQFAQTHTVKTRRGYHLYFRTQEKVPSHQFDGGDIKGEKSYVVCPPSRIVDFRYHVVKDMDPLAIDKTAVDRLLNYFHVDASVHLVKGKVVRDIGTIDLGKLYVARGCIGRP